MPGNPYSSVALIMGAMNQEDGHLIFGHQMKDKRTYTRREQRHRGIHAHEQRHQYSRTKGHKEELHTDNRLLHRTQFLIIHSIIINKV